MENGERKTTTGNREQGTDNGDRENGERKANEMGDVCTQAKEFIMRTLLTYVKPFFGYFVTLEQFSISV